ncbi:N-6 DNA methylase [Flavobacterium sp. WW92]|uniref:Eco57I restriction-modification methylase domain-containing protein n=1 Tax=unclassified Flavobacterium TaxID=196869 RepID=UPI0022257C5B|nr:MULTISPECIES: N-6 DNA methylase [unclassified Flavobacterium]WDO12491.1 N-6 DNA methylase [Flavobacterium sp. WW92]
MKQEIFKYLESYSFSTEKINRLIVSAFLYSNNIFSINNKRIKKLLITKECDDYNELTDFLKIQKLSSFEELIEAFEFVISPQEKIVTGAIYTPDYIRNYILDYALSNYDDFDGITICDPACGCAGFLYNVSKKIKNKTKKTYFDIFKTNIFGLDIQKYSVKRSELLLSLLAIIDGEDEEIFEFNFFKGNALNFKWDKKISNFEGFDIVVGNPPYVCSRNIDKESKEYLKLWTVCSSGHPDLYIPFFEIGLSILKPNGILGYITMNTFFKSINGRALREYFQKEKNKFILIDFGGEQVFHSKSTYTCLCLIKKTNSDFIQYSKLNNPHDLVLSRIKFNNILYSSLGTLNGWNLQEIEILNKIESIGTPLGEKFKTRNGIATLKNDIFIFDSIKEDDKYFYLQNGSLYQIEKEICKEIINPNKLTKIDSIEFLKKKIIFPYYHEEGNVKLIEETNFKNNFPKAYEYLQSKKQILAKRDKGNGKYENWFAYGRNQSIEKLKYKLFFPHITPNTPNFVVNLDEDLLFYNGLALISSNEKDLLFMKKIMSSRLFWFYIVNSSKPYGSGYFSLSRNYIKRFGIYDFTEEEINHLINEQDKGKLDDFIDMKYGIDTALLYRN